MYARSLCDSVILGHCFGLTMTSVPTIATCSISVSNRNNVSISRGKDGRVHNETKVEENRSAQFRVTTVVTTILLFHETLCATSNIRQWHFRIFQFQKTDFMQVVSSVYIRLTDYTCGWTSSTEIISFMLRSFMYFI
jgi:tRNA/tmRNA/rRNA uracil-C5-methylase (TrmA/RlmC/RlmD family)